MRLVKRLTILTVALVLFSAAALLEHRRATAFAPPNHNCPAVPSLKASSVKRGYPILIQTRNLSCAQALTIVRAMESNIGVTVVGNPEGPASQFRWKLFDLSGWTCYGDGSGFPGHGMGGSCAKGGATVQWYHA